MYGYIMLYIKVYINVDKNYTKIISWINAQVYVITYHIQDIYIYIL